jgi:hypothetical protein
VSSATATAPQQVFISYRREESAAYAGRIYDAMAGRFGDRNVFMDVEMPPGVDFVERIDEVLAGCAALIVVIGPRWPHLGDGRPRLQDPDDFVRREVAAALRRDDVTVIPALVGGAEMPRADQLPEDLRPLTRRNALELSHGRWRYDVSRLHTTIEEVFARRVPPAPRSDVPLVEGGLLRQLLSRAAPNRPRGGRDAVRLLTEGAAVAAVAAFLGRWLAELTPELAGSGGEVAEVAIQRGISWAVVGLALALWIGARVGGTVHLVFGLLAGLAAGVIGGLIWAMPVKLPDPPLDASAANRWALASLAATGAVLGALVGRLWRPRSLGLGLLGGLLGGLFTRLLLNLFGWEDSGMPALGFTFAALAAGVALGSVAAIATVVLSPRSSPPATAPGSR